MGYMRNHYAAINPGSWAPVPPLAPMPTEELSTEEIKNTMIEDTILRGTCCLCCLVPFLIIIFIWSLLPTEHAEYAFDELSISGLEPSALNASLINGTLTMKTSFRFQASNPGKRTRFSYSDIDVTVETLGLVIGYTQFAPFDLGHKSTKYISGNVQSGSLNLHEVSEAGVLALNKSGKVRLTMKLFARAHVAANAVLWTTSRYTELVNFSMDINVNTSNTADAPESSAPESQ